jgi:lipid II:glycine glycyltransferase (peptidoglycan interpeptide bridge formation enzyme)/uncharacterized membrane protein (UPF0127 family)
MKPAIPSVHIKKTSIPVEVSKDTGSIRKGLSGRDSLKPGCGMLFVFPRPKQYRFWMRNMNFPLDIIWIREGKVVAITEGVKNEFDQSHPFFYKAPQKVDRVLEVNAGFAKRKGVSVGDPVTYENVGHDFDIVAAKESEKNTWNQFIEKNQQIVGAFLETWEWGDFQKSLGLRTRHYFIKEKDEIVAVFILSFYKLPFGQSYGYMPRGPVIAKERIAEEVEHFEILKAIQEWAKKELKHLIFLRMEPSLPSLSEDTAYYGLRKPSYHIQPPRNTIVSLSRTEEEILAHFHSSTRSNIKRAERRGVTVEIKKEFTEEDYGHFFSMIKSTIKRNHGKKAYPSEQYFRTFLSANRIADGIDPNSRPGLSIVIFCGYQHGKPATTHVVIFSGTTATYLFGASHTEHLSSKVDTYLHWVAMREAKRLGMRYYDIGGIDEKIWPTLTKFKKQFSDEEAHYVGNSDVPLKPLLYHAYNVYRKTMKKIHDQA